MKKQKGFVLIGVLLILGALITTAGGVVVWKGRIPSEPTPTPIPKPSSILTPMPSPTPPETTSISCQTDRDYPPSLGCWPLSEQCYTWKCIDSYCIKVTNQEQLQKRQ